MLVVKNNFSVKELVRHLVAELQEECTLDDGTDLPRTRRFGNPVFSSGVVRRYEPQGSAKHKPHYSGDFLFFLALGNFNLL